MKWVDFEKFYNALENFDYPHKDKLLEFIKYFFLDHIESTNVININWGAFRDHIVLRRGPQSAEKSKSALRSRRKSGDSLSMSGDDSIRRRALALSDDEK